jgi:hypothetical protein
MEPASQQIHGFIDLTTIHNLIKKICDFPFLFLCFSFSSLKVKPMKKAILFLTPFFFTILSLVSAIPHPDADHPVEIDTTKKVISHKIDGRVEHAKLTKEGNIETKFQENPAEVAQARTAISNAKQETKDIAKQNAARMEKEQRLNNKELMNQSENEASQNTTSYLKAKQE